MKTNIPRQNHGTAATIFCILLIVTPIFNALGQKINIPLGDGINQVYYAVLPLTGDESNVTYVSINGTPGNRDFQCANRAMVHLKQYLNTYAGAVAAKAGLDVGITVGKELAKLMPLGRGAKIAIDVLAAAAKASQTSTQEELDDLVVKELTNQLVKMGTSDIPDERIKQGLERGTKALVENFYKKASDAGVDKDFPNDCNGHLNIHFVSVGNKFNMLFKASGNCLCNNKEKPLGKWEVSGEMTATITDIKHVDKTGLRKWLESDEYNVTLEWSGPKFNVTADCQCSNEISYQGSGGGVTEVAWNPVPDRQQFGSTGFYLRAEVGVGLGLTPEMLTQYTTNSTEGSSKTITESIKAHLGTGIPLGLDAGYQFDRHYGVELGFGYLAGFSKTKTDMSNNDVLTTRVSANSFSITPSFTMRTPCGPVIPYARIGPEIGVVNNYLIRMTGPTYMFKTAVSGERDTRDYGGISLGIKAAAGVECPIGKLVSVFGEVQAQAISFSPKHGKVTKYTVGGADELSTLSVKAKSWDYVTSRDNSAILPTSQPDQFLQVIHSLSNAAVVFGVKLNFGSHWK